MSEPEISLWVGRTVLLAAGCGLSAGLLYLGINALWYQLKCYKLFWEFYLWKRAKALQEKGASPPERSEAH